MPVSITQTPVQLFLTVKDSAGDVTFSERFDFASVADLPALPDVGEPWNLIIESTNFGGTTVTFKQITSQQGGHGFTTQIHISTVA